VAFAVLALALAGAAALAYVQAGKVDERLSLETRRTAEHAAEAVASRLTFEDIQQPMGEGRAGTISSFLERRLLDPSESVTIWSADAVIVFAADPALIGTQDRGLLTRISRVLSDGTQTETAGGSVHTFVAVAVGEGEGRPVVAEVIRPEEASPAGHPWIYASIAAAFLALLVLVAAVRTSGRQGYRPNGFGVDDLRRERKNLLQAQEALERSRTEEANLRSELERVAGDLALTKEALAAKETSIGEVDSRARAAEEQAARAEAELRAGVTVREEVARLIDTELQTARSELAMSKQQHEETQRQLESSRMAEAEREAAQAERDVLEAERDAIAAERDALRSLDERLRGELDAAKANLDIISREMTELGNRYQESAARAAHAEAKVLELNADRRELEDQRDPTGELQRTHAELEMTKNELGAALQKLETLGEQLVVSRGDLEAVRGEQELGNAELEGARAELEGARAELDAVRAEFHAIRAELDAARADATSSSGVRDSTLFELDSIRTQQETTTAALDETREELSASRAALEIARSNEERALAEAAEARSSFEALSADLSNAREETEAAWAEATALTSRMDEHVERAASAEARALELSQWVTELESRPDLTPALEDAKAALESAMDQLRDRDARFAAARDELDSIRIQQERTTAALDEANKELSASEAALGSARLELETARSNERQALAEAAALARRVDEHVERAAHAEARESELWQRITELESRPDLTPALEDARAALESAKDQLGDRDTRFAAAQNELVAIQTSLQAATARADALEAEVERAEAKAAELSSEVGLQEARSAELAAEVERAEARAEAAEGRAIDLSGRIEEHETSLRELAGRAGRAEGLVTELAARAERAEVRADEMAERAEAEIAAARERENPELEAARAEAEDLTGRLAVVTTELEAAAAFASALERRNEELEDQVASQAVSAEVDAADARARLIEAQQSLARLRETVEHHDELGSFVQEAPSMAPGTATEVADALSVNVKRSLSAIFELARTLSTDQENEDDERFLYQLMAQAKGMENAIRDIFDADRLTRGELVLERRNTEIDRLVDRVVREFPFAGDRDLDVAVEPATIMVDRVRVERLVDDLLNSAVGRTETGDRIALVLERAPDGVLISVEGGTPLNGDGTAGAAAAFLAGLHGGWTKAERLSDGTGVVRAFLPSGPNAGTADGADPEAAALLG
jgi:peptidoglycan hydrolase CwlO-like protein